MGLEATLTHGYRVPSWAGGLWSQTARIQSLAPTLPVCGTQHKLPRLSRPVLTTARWESELIPLPSEGSSLKSSQGSFIALQSLPTRRLLREAFPDHPS